MKSNEDKVQFYDGDEGRCRAYQIWLVRDHLFQGKGHKGRLNLFALESYMA